MATAHVAATHNPITEFTTWLAEHYRHRQRPASVPDVQALDVEALRLSLPLDEPDRHLLEGPALEDAFTHLAIDHPKQVAADREQLLLALVDEAFRHVFPAPMHRWSPQERALYEQLLDSTRAHPVGGSS
ncbi:hypothetical protein [Streptomyces sp. UG1]|uniref:hypothetical protein n=1 Tax=Streptomyces sp. UG1 TaxID=3417652 RepID=UPI003CF4A16D